MSAATPSTAPLAETLPPCCRHVVFSGRVAALTDVSKCPPDEPLDEMHEKQSTRFYVVAGLVGETRWELAHRPQWSNVGGAGAKVVFVLTDDEAEARAAYERAAEWVRTGAMPE